VQQTAIALMETSILPAARLIWARPGLKRDDVHWVDNALTMRSDTAPPIPRAVLAQKIHQEKLPVGVLGHAFFQAAWAEADYTVAGVDIRLKLDGLLLYRPNSDKPDFIERKNIKPPPPAAERYSRYVWAPCVNVVGLTVDKANGRVQVENVLSVLNAGRILVPELVSGQSQGGVAMAIGYTLLEDMPDGMTGPANGRWNLDRYHVPRWSDVPLLTTYQPGKRAQELIIMPETKEDGEAARGIAEAVMCSIAPAISNALRDAVGKRYSSLPITPAKILQGLGP
jgi:CO/xanthine dehydrogenase Mo-binding subunit